MEWSPTCPLCKAYFEVDRNGKDGPSPDISGVHAVTPQDLQSPGRRRGRREQDQERRERRLAREARRSARREENALILECARRMALRKRTEGATVPSPAAAGEPGEAERGPCSSLSPGPPAVNLSDTGAALASVDPLTEPLLGTEMSESWGDSNGMA